MKTLSRRSFIRRSGLAFAQVRPAESPILGQGEFRYRVVPSWHPHDLIVDSEGSLYVAQFASGKTYPVKLERV